MTKKTEPVVTKAKGLDLKKELIEELIERGKKEGQLTYEEVISFSDKNHLIEREVETLMRLLEKEHVELITEEELEKTHLHSRDPEKDEEHDHPLDLKTKFEDSFSHGGDEFDEEEDGCHVVGP